MKQRYDESFLFPQGQEDFGRSLNFPQGHLHGLGEINEDDPRFANLQAAIAQVAAQQAAAQQAAAQQAAAQQAAAQQAAAQQAAAAAQAEADAQRAAAQARVNESIQRQKAEQQAAFNEWDEIQNSQEKIRQLLSNLDYSLRSYANPEGIPVSVYQANVKRISDEANQAIEYERQKIIVLQQSLDARNRAASATTGVEYVSSAQLTAQVENANAAAAAAKKLLNEQAYANEVAIQAAATRARLATEAAAAAAAAQQEAATAAAAAAAKSSQNGKSSMAINTSTVGYDVAVSALKAAGKYTVGMTVQQMSSALTDLSGGDQVTVLSPSVTAAAVAATNTQTTATNTATGTVQTTDLVSGTTSTANASTGKVIIAVKTGQTVTGTGTVTAGGVTTTIDPTTGVVTTQNTQTGVTTQTDATTGKTVTGTQITGGTTTGGTFILPDGKTVTTTQPITSTTTAGGLDSGKIALFGLIGLLLLRGAVR